MPFQSILFDRPDVSGDGAAPGEPPFFADLNLDQVLAAITFGREEYDLKPFFSAPLHDVTAVQYRHDVMRDLEQRAVFDAVAAFAEQMRQMREHLVQAGKLRERYQRERWFLDAVARYGDAVSTLAEDLAPLDVQSPGLQAFRAYLASYTQSDGFTSLATETQTLIDDLASVRYCVHIKGNRVTVSKYNGEADYSAEIEATFAKFKQGAVKDHLINFRAWPEMDSVEARILGLVARLYPEIFAALDAYCGRHRAYLDGTIGRFDREVQFYLAYLEYIQRFKHVGLPFCYPEVSVSSKEEAVKAAFDLALATKLVLTKSAVICNDFFLEDPQRILVVTGPNQGGKTTFARMFGQLHYLASLGLPVPARVARLFLPDQLFTHFEREEDLSTLRSKLEDELVRMHAIFDQATGNSLLIMNESLTSTTLDDALLLGTAVLKQIIALGLLGVCVTFIDELASLSASTVSMVSTIVPDNPAERTYKIVRKPADGLAYAAAIAEKYGLTHASLRERVAR